MWSFRHDRLVSVLAFVYWVIAWRDWLDPEPAQMTALENSR